MENASEIPEECASRFRVEALLGHGACGAVYQAVQVALGRPVALKVLRGPVCMPDQVARFLDEARITTRLAHPGIIVVLDSGHHNGRPWIAYELLDGPTLAARIDDGPIPLDEAVDIAAQIADALDAAHRAGVLHRDLKPANVMRACSGCWKILDFGLARLGAGIGLTRTGAMVGTPAYMAPEIFSGELASVASDVFALGAVTYEMLTRRWCHSVYDFWQHLTRLRAGELPPPSSVAPEVPPALDALVMAALSGDPARRPTSACDFAVALRAALPAQRQPASKVASPGPPRRLPTRPSAKQAPRHERAWGQAGIAFAGLVLLLALRWSRPPAPDLTPPASPVGPFAPDLVASAGRFAEQVSALSRSDPATRRSAIAALEKQGDDHAVQLLAAIAWSRGAERLGALEALGRLSLPSARIALLELARVEWLEPPLLDALAKSAANGDARVARMARERLAAALAEDWDAPTRTAAERGLAAIDARAP